jgi:transposase InsO family protein
MPWSCTTVEKSRSEFVSFAQRPGANISALALRFGISRKTAYKWLSRVRQSAPCDFAPDATPSVEHCLVNRSRRPIHSPQRTEAQIEAQILALRDAHPAWGGRKLACLMHTVHAVLIAPSTVSAVLHRHGRISALASEAATPWQRFEHERANALWQIDFKGHFAAGLERCHALTALDDHSRFNVVLQACDNERGITVKAHLTRAFSQYGLPERINVDNGAPWGSQGAPYLTTVALWWIRLGIKVSHSRILHPQTNGKDERFHRTLKAEVITQEPCRSNAQMQTRFDLWRPIYNEMRPHEALGMKPPISRYSPSPRVLPERLPDIEYGPSDIVRKVQYAGLISFRGKQYRVGSALHGYPVALRQNDQSGSFEVFFCHQKIRTLHPNSDS